MNNLLLGLTTLVIVFLIHFAVVDFRFRIAGGLAGIWGQNPAPVGLWIVRLTLVPPIVAALSIVPFGPSKALWIIIGVLLLIHIISLFLLKAFPLE